MDWSDVKNHIGEVVTMKGMFMWAGLGKNVKSPVWLNIGAAYPNRDRVDLLIWPESKSFFPDLIDGSLEGKYLCVRGKARVYKGIVQIELTSPNQVSIAN